MLHDALAQYQYLWDGSDPGWVLLHAPDLVGKYCVFHKTNRVLLHIDDSALNKAVCEKMKENGCEVFETMPPGTSKITVSQA